MGFFKKLGCVLTKILQIFCPAIHAVIFSGYHQKRKLKIVMGFLAGFALGLTYYYYLLKKIPFPYNIGVVLALLLSVLLGLGNACVTPIRCISLLIFPMYCGQAGRGVLKAVVLTYVIAGPITNMGLNAKEVVRVFACSAQLSHNLSKTRYALMAHPFKNALLALKSDVGEVKDTLRSIRDVVAPIEHEVEDTEEVHMLRNEYDVVMDDTINYFDTIERKYRSDMDDEEKDVYQKKYIKKMEYRCEHELTRANLICRDIFALAHARCMETLPEVVNTMFCSPMKLQFLCNVLQLVGPSICDAKREIDPGLGEGYVFLKKSKDYLSHDFKDVKLQYKISYVTELTDTQDAKETGIRVMRAFEEKCNIMKLAMIVLDIFMALLFLRIVAAAVNYHDLYLTCIDYDNRYITDYFKEIDQKRKEKGKYTLLPLKKMERSRYIDIHSVKYIGVERHKLLPRTLKVLLEMVTASTFVMLDRLFYEALYVVRQHAEMDLTLQGNHDTEITVEGTGMVAGIVRRVFSGFNTNVNIRRTVSNRPCLPAPRLMPPSFYFKIYGGYLWIVLLLYVNAYTMRLRRLICSYFYPQREKQRILHLYNDILKKRMKMIKTLRKKAVQAVRAHYLSGENLLSLRMKFPQLLGWLKIVPAARMTCLICGETEPRIMEYKDREDAWHACSVTKCPFIYCGECWREIGRQCLACDPSLAELSDVDSLTDEELPRY